MSQSSAPSKGIDDMMGRSGKDPRAGQTAGQRQSILVNKKSVTIASGPVNEFFR